MKKILILCLLVPIFSFAVGDFSDFDGYQDRWTRGELEQRLLRFIGGEALSYLEISDEAVSLYDLPEGEKERKVEFRLSLAKEKRSIKSPPRRSDLVGAKVAIDPGHFGGEYARLEERYIDIPPSLEREESIQFDEGSLSFLTAVYLKLLLEKEGAIVMITRDQIGKGVYEDGFFDWLKKTPELWTGEVALNKLFRRYYNPLDLRARAAKINAFSPEISVAIHFNSHAGRDDVSSNHSVVSNNFNLAFIGGSFCQNELRDPASRYEMVRMLVTEDLPRSLLLSQAVVGQLVAHLNVPMISAEDGARYLERVCKKVKPGVYSRNLALTRQIHGPVIYGESLVQNNVDECLNLARKDFVIDGIRCSSRVKEVAEAYFDGIKEFLLEN